jgi:thiamine-monophosphate kinase
MRISLLGEFGLIDIIRKRNPIKDRNVVAGIGDDTAVVKKTSNKYILMTTDTIVENVHFKLNSSTFYELGWRVLAVNISDIAAMGGIPKYALVTLGLKKNMKVAEINEFYSGMKALARKYKIDIVGGDIVSSPKSLFFTVDLFGVADKVIKRNGARVGDAIVSIGAMGGAAARKYHHLMPKPMIKESRLAARYATAMIDNSDGLSRCLIEICRASKVGARINSSGIPVARRATIKQALHGGEDYNLVLTVPKSKVRLIKGAVIIGEITKNRSIVMIDRSGKEKIILDKGYEHF